MTVLAQGFMGSWGYFGLMALALAALVGLYFYMRSRPQE
jgi:hypothetical protein